MPAFVESRGGGGVAVPGAVVEHFHAVNVDPGLVVHLLLEAVGAGVVGVEHAGVADREVVVIPCPARAGVLVVVAVHFGGHHVEGDGVGEALVGEPLGAEAGGGVGLAVVDAPVGGAEEGAAAEGLAEGTALHAAAGVGAGEFGACFPAAQDGHVLKHHLAGGAVVVARHVHAEHDVAAHVGAGVAQAVGAGPVGAAAAVGRPLDGEHVARALEVKPVGGRGRAGRAADRGAAGATAFGVAILQDDAVAGGGRDVHVRVVVVDAVAVEIGTCHEARLGPAVGVLLAHEPHGGHEVAADRLVHVVEAIGGAPDIAAAADDGVGVGRAGRVVNRGFPACHG